MIVEIPELDRVLFAAWLMCMGYGFWQALVQIKKNWKGGGK